MAGWVGRVGWLIADALPTKWLNSLAQDRESSPARTDVLTTMLYTPPIARDSISAGALLQTLLGELNAPQTP